MRLLELLKDSGCKPRNYGTYITCTAKYRGGDDPSSVAIYLGTNIVKDFVNGKVFSLEEFLKVTLQLKDIKQVEDILKDKATYFKAFNDTEDPFTKSVKYYSNDDIVDLKRDSFYWGKRGVSQETLDVFEGGVCKTGKMYQRYVFPIFNARKKIQGFSGRDITGQSRIKWKHIGRKNEWAYPFIFNHQIIREKRELILVESIGDMLSLWQSGIKNTGVTFGTEAGGGLLKAIIRLDPKRIILATNNDDNRAGQKAATKIQSTLVHFFDPAQLHIFHPYKNDFGDQTVEENQEWYSNI
jgi:Toprim-like